MVEKCYMHLVAGPNSIFELTEVQAEYLQLMEEGYTLIKEQLSPMLARKLLVARLPKLTSRRYSAIQIIHDAQELFGRFEKVHKTTQRGVIRERLIERIQFCEKQLHGLTTDDSGQKHLIPDNERVGWEKLIQNYLSKLVDLDRLTEDEEVAQDTSLPDILLSDDPEVLKEQTEDIEFEEI